MEKNLLHQSQIMDVENKSSQEVLSPEKLIQEKSNVDVLKSLLVFLRNSSKKGVDFQKNVLSSVLGIKSK